MLVYDQYAFLQFLCRSFLLGVLLGGIYDAIRISRILFGITAYSPGRRYALYDRSFPIIGRVYRVRGRGIGRLLAEIIVFAGDLLFMLTSGIGLLTVAFFENNGKLRLFMIIVTFIGFFMYRLSIGRAVMYFSSIIVFIIRLSVRYIFYFLTYPIRLLYKLIRYLSKRLWRSVLDRIIALRLKNCSERLKRELTEKSKYAFVFSGASLKQKAEVKKHEGKKKIRGGL